MPIIKRVGRALSRRHRGKEKVKLGLCWVAFCKKKHLKGIKTCNEHSSKWRKTK